MNIAPWVISPNFFDYLGQIFSYFLKVKAAGARKDIYYIATWDGIAMVTQYASYAEGPASNPAGPKSARH